MVCKITDVTNAASIHTITTIVSSIPLINVVDPTGLAMDASGDLFIADTGADGITELSSVTRLTIITSTGVAGYSGDSPSAVAAKLRGPEGVAVNKFGNVYIADTGNNRIREIYGSGSLAGTIITIAGTGLAGNTGNGLPATKADLSSPEGIALDASGDIFISDTGNNRVREVTAGTIAAYTSNGVAGYSGDGGQATAAELNGPAGVTVTSTGDVTIADQANNVVRTGCMAPRTAHWPT